MDARLTWPFTALRSVFQAPPGHTRVSDDAGWLGWARRASDTSRAERLIVSGLESRRACSRPRTRGRPSEDGKGVRRCSGLCFQRMRGMSWTSTGSRIQAQRFFSVSRQHTREYSARGGPPRGSAAVSLWLPAPPPVRAQRPAATPLRRKCRRCRGGMTRRWSCADQRAPTNAAAAAAAELGT